MKVAPQLVAHPTLIIQPAPPVGFLPWYYLYAGGTSSPGSEQWMKYYGNNSHLTARKQSSTQ
jgi:hypothetical protein